MVICTRDNADKLAVLLAALATNSPGVDREVVVVDNGSVDDTAAVVAQAPTSDGHTVRYVLEPRHGKGYAYNAGILAAAGDVLIFTDDDVRPADGWIAAHVREFDEYPDTDAAQGRVVLELPDEVPAWFTELHRSFLAEIDLGPIQKSQWTGWLVGANMSFRRTVALEVGPFDPVLGPGRSGFWDDTEWSQRLMNAGFRQAYVGTAVVHHIVEADRLDRRYWRDLAWRNARSRVLARAVFPREAFEGPTLLPRLALSALKGAVLRGPSTVEGQRFHLRWLLCVRVASLVGERRLRRRLGVPDRPTRWETTEAVSTA